MTLTEVGHTFTEGRFLFAGISATFDSGEMVAVAGPSGSGKSTLLAIVSGWLDPACGHVERSGVRRTQWVLQRSFGTPNRTALDHAVLPLIANGNSRDQAELSLVEPMARFGLANVAHRRFRDLSGGEAQRLMLLRALQAEPDLLLIDEPTAQLDRNNAAEVVAVLREVASGDHLVMVASHDSNVIAACDRVLDLQDGHRWARARR